MPSTESETGITEKPKCISNNKGFPLALIKVPKGIKPVINTRIASIINGIRIGQPPSFVIEVASETGLFQKILKYNRNI